MADWPPSEVAEILVRGVVARDWETVWVQLRDGEAWDEFRFSTAERDPATEWEDQIFIPGDDCTITLGGITALSGTIVQRQVAYDATSHAVQLYGKTGTVWATKSSAKTKTGSFDEKTFMEIVEEVYHHGYMIYPNKIRLVGKENKEKLHQIQIQQGESNWQFLERIGRPIGAIMSSDRKGDIVVIWPRQTLHAGALVEGENILKCNCLVNEDVTFFEFLATAQTDNASGKEGKDAQEIVSDPVKGSARQPSLKVILAEGPLKAKIQATARAHNGRRWTDLARVEMHITVQGWINPQTGDLWLPGQTVSVYSPMILFDGQQMGIKSATFTQDVRSGTLTILELWQPERLNMNGYDATNPPKNINQYPPPPPPFGFGAGTDSPALIGISGTPSQVVGGRFPDQNQSLPTQTPSDVIAGRFPPPENTK